jgi:N-acetylglucosamine kinase-like BadF-type ATPase
MSRLFLGVDGGQSSTTALIGDETGRVLGAGAGGPCNHVGAAEGRQKLIRAVGDCVARACEGAGLDPATVAFEAACFGMSGGPEDKQAILAEILKAGKLVATTDAVIALAGATAGRPGIITIAGTGSIAFGRNAQGRTARAGGWGFVFGDEGGGFDITRQALRAALRMEEGWGPPTVLREALLNATGARDANDLLHRFYTQEYPRPKIASYSRLVDTQAQSGDLVATDILRQAGAQLGALARSVRKRLFAPGETPALAYIGGVFRSAVLLEHFRQIAGECGPPAYGPAAGALLEAYRAAGLNPELSNMLHIKL